MAIQTVIDTNKKDNNETTLIITDVAKAFDQAWRTAVFKNLMERGVKGRILKVMWKMNNNLVAKIKTKEMMSEEFEVEGSLRHTHTHIETIYGQHISKLIEEMEKEKIGKAIGNINIPAIAWQDDVTGIVSNKEEISNITKSMDKSARLNKIYFSKDNKCKIMTIDKDKKEKDEEGETKIGEVVLDKIKSAKILGYTFNIDNNNNSAHIEEKEKKTIEMVASLGLTIEDINMGNAFIQTMLILYEKCFIPKLVFGFTGFYMSEKEVERMENINRNILRNFAGLPKCTPKLTLYVEFGTFPLKMEIYKRKLLTWKRINREESNNLIKSAVLEQIQNQLPWIKQIVKIGIELGINIIEGRKMKKDKWKRLIKERIEKVAKEDLEKEIEKIKKYKEIVKDEIRPGEQKKYMVLSMKKAASMFRARTNLMDPVPRKPYWEKRMWRCKFCREKSQDSKVIECEKTREMFKKMTRTEAWRIITTLEAELKEIKEVAGVVQRIIREINK